MRKRIGVVGTLSDNIFGVSAKYMQFANMFGDVHILTPTTPIQEDLDLLILKGGQDIDPLDYGQAPEFRLSNSNPYQEYFDKIMLPEYIKQKTPIFGICRGMQEINVF